MCIANSLSDSYALTLICKLMIMDMLVALIMYLDIAFCLKNMANIKITKFVKMLAILEIIS